MYTPYDDDPMATQHPWTPPFHPTPQTADFTGPLLIAAQALCDRVRAATTTCALRAGDAAAADDEGDPKNANPQAALDELAAEMRKIDLCLQQMLLAFAPVAIPTTDADFTADLDVDFVPTLVEAA